MTFTLMWTPKAFLQCDCGNDTFRLDSIPDGRFMEVVCTECHHSALVRWQDDDTGEMHPCVMRGEHEPDISEFKDPDE